MQILLLLLMCGLLWRFPPGTNWAFELAALHVVIPVGWCLLVSLVLSACDKTSRSSIGLDRYVHLGLIV